MSALLKEAEALRLEGTTRILSMEEEIENIKGEHIHEISMAKQAWEAALKQEVDQARSSRLRETKETKKEVDLQRTEEPTEPNDDDEEFYRENKITPTHLLLLSCSERKYYEELRSKMQMLIFMSLTGKNISP